MRSILQDLLPAGLVRRFVFMRLLLLAWLLVAAGPLAAGTGETPVAPRGETPVAPRGETPVAPRGETPVAPSGETPGASLPELSLVPPTSTGETPVPPSRGTPVAPRGETPVLPSLKKPRRPWGRQRDRRPRLRGGWTLRADAVEQVFLSRVETGDVVDVRKAIALRGPNWQVALPAGTYALVRIDLKGGFIHIAPLQVDEGKVRLPPGAERLTVRPDKPCALKGRLAAQAGVAGGPPRTDDSAPLRRV